ncbi:MAG: TIGR02147 family protein [Bdellovibrionaceae bacterium]|nr:TIGR02147 family protein [Pseudobdellovibrionaceae bacterium]
MAKSLYEYNNYKTFVNEWLAQAPNQGHGLRKKLASAMNCQTAYVSHVFSGNYNLSPEQAYKCCQWLNLDSEETEYFLLLVNYQRAGSKELERYYLQQIKQLRTDHVNIKKRSNIKESLSIEDQYTYYSHWAYGAIHMAVTIHGLQTVEALHDHFNFSIGFIQKALNFLESCNLVAKEKNLYKIGGAFIHLERNSLLMSKHHSNWRIRALEAINENSNENLHYSGVMSMSEEDFENLREKIIGYLKEIFTTVKDSKEETLVSLCMDWFKV